MRTTCAKTKASPRTEGFTLIEALVTVAIAAVLLAIGMPGMANLLSDARLASQSDLLVSTLNHARTQALQQRMDFTVCPAITPNAAAACTPGLQAWGTGWITFGNAAVRQRVEAKSGVTVTAAFDDVSFRGTVGSAMLARSFVVCASGRRQHLVDVNLSGSVRKRIGNAVCP